MTDALILLREAGDAAEVLQNVSGLAVYRRSITADSGDALFLGRRDTTRCLGLVCTREPDSRFDLDYRTVQIAGQELTLGLGQADEANAAALRARLPFTAPQRVGVRKSVGLGDRLGIATPGHIRALRHVEGIVPILAQQSIREMERTQRSPRQVIDAATWGVFQEGWREGYGADADHLKSEQDIDRCVEVGFVMYTLDPRAHVDNDAETDSLSTLKTKYVALPWDELETTAQDTRQTYLQGTWRCGPECQVCFTEEQLLRAACKYGRALAHLAAQYRYLAEYMAEKPFEVEVSVDETETPTKPIEHFYIARELDRLGVEWVSLAPRYVGRFEKGVDYIGDLDAFGSAFAQHVAIAKTLGPYKLSLHSGSDKFSIYPIVARLAGELVHLKTAGTSYLEALRAIARTEPALFREILEFAVANYEHDKASYHVSAEMSKAPDLKAVADEDLDDVLDQFDARQALHVTFGTVLTRTDREGSYVFRDRLFEVLERDEEAHYDALEAHIRRHIEPFA